jgi:hypothetical protein
MKPGERAQYAGGVEQSQPRKYGVLLPRFSDGRRSPDIGPLREGLAQCGGSVEVQEVTFQEIATAQDIAAPNRDANTQAMSAFRSHGVTSVILFAGASFSQVSGAMRAADSLGYNPEWIEPGTVSEEAAASYFTAPSDQLAHWVAISSGPYPLQASLRPEERAGLMMAPKSPPSSDLGPAASESVYAQLALLAAGIQAAGPRLTPDTFASGLSHTDFPNPGTGSSPYFQARVGILQRPQEDRSLVQDFMVRWWSNSAREPGASSTDTGGFCYAESAHRWSPGTWPTQPIPLFVPNQRC